VLTWDDVNRSARELAERLRPLGPWRGLAALTRGALAPAAIVASHLDIRLIETICMVSYVGAAHDERKEIEIFKSPSLGDGAGWLILDDLVDTGRSFEILRQLFPLATYAVLYAKPQGRPLTDYFIDEIAQTIWIKFPWEHYEN
jgi:xanthine phosphoribosyltransferase